MNIVKQIAGELGVSTERVSQAVALLDEGNTVPFIARYRKEMTGSLEDEQLRNIEERLVYLRNLERRREEVRTFLQENGLLTGDLGRMLDASRTLVEVEDIYLPYRPKRVTRASKAREQGLEPLASTMLTAKVGDRLEILKTFVNPQLGVGSPDEALQGARDILAERFSEDPRIRRFSREQAFSRGTLTAEPRKKTQERNPYEAYYGFSQPVAQLAPHRVLALNRGEQENFLTVKLTLPELDIMNRMLKSHVQEKVLFLSEIKLAVFDGFKRLLAPAVEREVRAELTVLGEQSAIRVFGANLKKLLLQPPVRGRRVLGFDPAFRTGCKLACVDEAGNLLACDVIYPTPPESRIMESKETLKQMIRQHGVDLISLGNGTACRESEEFLEQVLQELDMPVVYTITSEAGASVYSASALGKEEFPKLDVTLRSAVSIARRVIDPLAELVKIDPKAIGVGQYQHDVNQKRLRGALDNVVEDCVNAVGVDVNTASAALLERVAGIRPTVAQSILKARTEKGRFQNRQELLKVRGLGPKMFQQAAGFLRISGGDQPLDATGVHPEAYEATQRLLQETGLTIGDMKTQADHLDVQEYAARLGFGEPTLRDILLELKKPGRDPRDQCPPPMFQSGVTTMDDLREGMCLKGVVRNVVDFGAFVDIGVHQDGLVHVSELSDSFVKDPFTVVGVGDQVDVRILEIDKERGRVSLTMKTSGGCKR